MAELLYSNLMPFVLCWPGVAILAESLAWPDDLDVRSRCQDYSEQRSELCGNFFEVSQGNGTNKQSTFNGFFEKIQVKFEKVAMPSIERLGRCGCQRAVREGQVESSGLDEGVWHVKVPGSGRDDGVLLKVRFRMKVHASETTVQKVVRRDDHHAIALVNHDRKESEEDVAIH